MAEDAAKSLVQVLKEANHPKGWNAKLLAFVPIARDKVADLPGDDA